MLAVDYDSACGLFAVLRKKDPLRLTDMDIFSHMLFVMVRQGGRGAAGGWCHLPLSHRRSCRSSVSWHRRWSRSTSIERRPVPC